MVTVVVEIERGILTAFRAHAPDVRLLVLDGDVEMGGEDPATLRESPDPVLATDYLHITEILEANPEAAGGLP